MVGDEIVNSRGHTSGGEIVTLCSAGAVEMNEVTPTIRPYAPSIGWTWLRCRRWCFSFDSFTFGNFFTRGSWWWSWRNRRDKACSALLDLEHSISEVKSLHIGSREADLIERRQLLSCRIKNRDHLRRS